jgi:hypothetical protein
MFINGKEFLTVKELSERSKRTPKAVKQFLFREGIKPESKDALYNIEALHAILNAPPQGRPKKPASEAPKKPRKSTIRKSGQ